MNAEILAVALVVELVLALVSWCESWIRSGRAMFMHFSGAYLPEDAGVME